MKEAVVLIKQMAKMCRLIWTIFQQKYRLVLNKQGRRVGVKKINIKAEKSLVFFIFPFLHILTI